LIFKTVYSMIIANILLFSVIFICFLLNLMLRKKTEEKLQYFFNLCYFLSYCLIWQDLTACAFSDTDFAAVRFLLKNPLYAISALL